MLSRSSLEESAPAALWERRARWVVGKNKRKKNC